MNIGNYNSFPQKADAADEIQMSDYMNNPDGEQYTYRLEKKAKIAIIITLSVLALNLFVIFFLAFGINPVIKMNLQMMFFDNCQISIEAERHIHVQYSPGRYEEKTSHYDIATIYIDGNIYAIETEDMQSHYNYDYYEVDGDVLYQYIYDGIEWMKIECEDKIDIGSEGEVEGEEDLFAILLDPRNFKKDPHKLGVWHIKNGVSKTYNNLMVTRKNGKYIYYWTESNYTFYITFHSFGQSNLDIPWD